MDSWAGGLRGLRSLRSLSGIKPTRQCATIDSNYHWELHTHTYACVCIRGDLGVVYNYPRVCDKLDISLATSANLLPCEWNKSFRLDTLDITVYLGNKSATGKKHRKTIRVKKNQPISSLLSSVDHPHQNCSPWVLGCPASADWGQ